MNKNRTDIALSIAMELLEQDVLDMNNFDCDIDAILHFVQETILNHLQDYLIISGTLM